MKRMLIVSICSIAFHCSENESKYYPLTEYYSIEKALANVENCEGLVLRYEDSVSYKVGWLYNMQSLYVFDSQIEELPPTIAQLTKLSRLWISRDKFKKIPSVVYLLRILSNLNISYNDIKAIPDSISQLGNITYFYADNNLIDSVSPGLFRIRYITTCNLDSNRLRWLPDEIQNIVGWKKIYLRGNLFSEEEKSRIRSLVPASTEVFF